jgi:hypothetical protein
MLTFETQTATPLPVRCSLWTLAFRNAAQRNRWHSLFGNVLQSLGEKPLCQWTSSVNAFRL